MEIKEYWNIIKRDRYFLLGVVMAVIGLSFAYFFLRPEKYQASLILNITRTGTQAAQDYRFDDFYRLQADEKYAETIVEWLKSPRVVSDIYQEAEIEVSNLSLRQLSRAFEVDKLSAQVVSVGFAFSDERKARDVCLAIVNIVEKNTQELNAEQKNATWFKIISQEPVIVRQVFSGMTVFVASFLVGFFLGFWLVMLRHFLK